MQIRKNTKAFKTILEIVTACQGRADREQLIRLYITRAGHSIKDRISVESIQGEAELFYDMGYQAILNNLRSSNHQLHQSEDPPGIYYFHTTSNKTWDETPFEFDESVREQFATLTDLPATRKKGKSEKFALPQPIAKTVAKTEKKQKAPQVKAAKAREKEPRQPAYALKHRIHFTELDKVIFRHPQFTKNDVLDYYDKVAEHVLPYLKDRPVTIRRHGDNARRDGYNSLQSLEESKVKTPDWLQTIRDGRTETQLLLCNDRDHLLFYAETGAITFASTQSRVKSMDSPDRLVIGIDSDGEPAKVIEVALAVRTVLDGLKIPSFVKTDGASGFHVYVPLDGKYDFGTAHKAAEYLCRLIRVKAPDLVALERIDENSYRRVSLDFRFNEKGTSVIAPYSLVPDRPLVATPLSWDEVREQPKPDDYRSVFRRLRSTGDPFERLFKRKASAGALFEQLRDSYSFLF